MMKRILTVTLGVALGSLATSAVAAPNRIPTSEDPVIYRDSGDTYSRDRGYSEPRSARRPARRARRARTRDRSASRRSARRHAARSGGRRTAARTRNRSGVARRSFTRYASPGTSRTCLSAGARALLNRIEGQFGRVQVISTCRPGARIAGTNRISRHASGNAVDFNAPSGRKAAVVQWLIRNHRSGGVMTYAGMSHIHVDIGPRFVSLNSGGRSYRR